MDKLHELKALKFTFCFPFFFFFISNLSAVKEGELTDSISTKSKDNDSLPSVSLVRKQFGGRYAISSEEFTSEMVRLVKLTVRLCMRRIFFPFIALMEVDFNFLRLELNPEISHIWKENCHCGSRFLHQLLSHLESLRKFFQMVWIRFFLRYIFLLFSSTHLEYSAAFG